MEIPPPAWLWCTSFDSSSLTSFMVSASVGWSTDLGQGLVEGALHCDRTLVSSPYIPAQRHNRTGFLAVWPTNPCPVLTPAGRHTMFCAHTSGPPASESKGERRQIWVIARETLSNIELSPLGHRKALSGTVWRVPDRHGGAG